MGEAPLRGSREETEAIVLLSGGIDSATCLRLAKREGRLTRALTIEIHGTAAAELLAAKRLGRRLEVAEHRFARVPDLRDAKDISGSSELSRGEVAPTYIPMKNAIFYSLAAAYAEEKGARYIIGGHNGDDQRLFDDTSEDFFVGLEKTLLAGSRRLRKNNLSIERPLKDMTKADVIALGARIEVPFELTWSCHRAGAAHCWKCVGCKRRREAFEEAGVSDPLFSKKV